jgi:hypothetical protein
MEDFRTQLSACIDEMLAQGLQPVFLVVDLEGAGQIKRMYDAEALERFRESACSAISSAGGDCDTFSYGEERIIAVLAGIDRLKSFAIAEKLRRGMPLLGQSFDAALHVEFDFIDYDAATGIPGLIGQLTRPRPAADAA